jgi:hypothetical protein
MVKASASQIRATWRISSSDACGAGRRQSKAAGIVNAASYDFRPIGSWRPPAPGSRGARTKSAEGDGRVMNAGGQAGGKVGASGGSICAEEMNEIRVSAHPCGRNAYSFSSCSHRRSRLSRTSTWHEDPELGTLGSSSW